MILGNLPAISTIPKILLMSSTPATLTSLVLLHVPVHVLVPVLVFVLVLQPNLSIASRFLARILQLGGPRYRGGRYCQDSAS
jgi:hypothetical protein